jgi:hypothetical protein
MHVCWWSIRMEIAASQLHGVQLMSPVITLVFASPCQLKLYRHTACLTSGSGFTLLLLVACLLAGDAVLVCATPAAGEGVYVTQASLRL